MEAHQRLIAEHLSGMGVHDRLKMIGHQPAVQHPIEILLAVEEIGVPAVAVLVELAEFPLDGVL